MMRLLSFILVLLGAAVSASAQPAPEPDPARMILGAWVSESDPKSQWMFLPGGRLTPSYAGVAMSERRWAFVETAHIFHGAADTDVPLFIPRLWQQNLRNAGFEVRYTEIPWSSHWHYARDPQHLFFKSIN